jgi:D-3-phosphoglycerate dehydrogenase / 2-oxoglutarate reductase
LNAAPLGGAMAEPPLVVVADPIDAEALATLRAGPCRVVDASSEPSGLARHLAGAWGLVVRSRTQVTAELLAGAPALRLVARAGVGLDNVDVAAARALGIEVVNVPEAATTSVAELTVAFYLLLVRGLLPSIVSTKAGRWEKGTHGHELAGRTVGFVGYGRIAREVARRVSAFGVRTVAFDPFLAASPDATELLPLDRLLAEAEIVSVHAALTSENRHLLGRREFGQMRDGAFLVNVARGALVDEAALLEALRGGRLAGAALDVFETEPPTQSELLADPRVVCTPHLGASTQEAQRKAGSGVVDAVLRALAAAAPTRRAPAPEAR